MNTKKCELFEKFDSSDDNVKKRCEFITDANNPFDPRYYPTLPFYQDRVVYKPSCKLYEENEGMSAYFYLGAKLAIAGRDFPASTWIKAHGNDTE